MRRTHSLKTWPEPWEAVREGRKRFEWRFDDRGFAVGDLLLLRLWDPSPSTGFPDGAYQSEGGGRLRYEDGARTIRVRVTYVARGFGIPDGWVVLGIEPEPADAREGK